MSATDVQAGADVQEQAVLLPSVRQPNEFLMEIELDARIHFGSRDLPLHDLLELSAGDVIELDRLILDPVDLMIGDRIVARGEVVVMGGNFALQVTEVMSGLLCAEPAG